MSHGRSNPSKKKSTSAALLAPIVAAPVELGTTHPLDTIVRRTQYHRGKIFVSGSLRASYQNFYVATLQQGNLYAGFGYGFTDKAIKRVYKFGGQRLVMNGLEQNLGEDYIKQNKTLLEFSAGAAMGIGEVAFLPIDNIKITKQIDPKTFGNKSVFEIVATSRFNLYKGGSLTILRNAPGSGLLFGGAAAYYSLMDINEKEASIFQRIAASSFGASFSVIGTLPLDVVKTRVQKESHGANPVNGRAVARKMWKEEGAAAFAKGNMTKVTSSIFKVALGLTFTRKVQDYLEDKFNPEDLEKPVKKPALK